MSSLNDSERENGLAPTIDGDEVMMRERQRSKAGKEGEKTGKVR